ncbi:MAG: hypothetical protein RL637_306 [Pseudomonadota bacterium]|jgi:uncharacterized protein
MLQSIVLKPIGAFCNLRCHYCFYLDKQHLYPGSPSHHRMKEPTLIAMIEQMFDCSPNPTFVWQGGEPTVIGLDFFQQAIEIQKHYAKGRRFFNSLQTHGMLLNSDWVEFLQKENFLVGLSLDGPEFIHDHYRVDTAGKGTFQTVYQNALLMQQAKVEFNVLATISDYAVQFPQQIYQFFADNHFLFMQFSPVVELDPNSPQQAAAYTVDPIEYGKFLYQVFESWEKDFDYSRLKQKTSIRWFDSVLQTYVGITPDHCIFHKTCNDYLVLEHNGDIFSCDFFVEMDRKLGNIHQISLSQAFKSPQHIAFGLEKAHLNQECRECEWLKQCYGGCIKDRLRDPKDQGHNHFCESYRYFFRHAHPKLTEFANLYRKYYQ